MWNYLCEFGPYSQYQIPQNFEFRPIHIIFFFVFIFRQKKLTKPTIRIN